MHSAVGFRKTYFDSVAGFFFRYLFLLTKQFLSLSILIITSNMNEEKKTLFPIKEAFLYPPQPIATVPVPCTRQTDLGTGIRSFVF